MMMVGIVVGSGIFLTTGIMAESVPSTPLLLLAWGVGGVLTLAGALTFAELGAALPEAGGPYVYLREAYGHMWGFLFGWILFLVSMGGSIAALGVGFAEYLGYFIPGVASDRVVLALPFVPVSSGQLVALATIVFLSAFTYLGVGYGKGIQNFATVLKLATLVLFVIVGLALGGGLDGREAAAPPPLPSGSLVVGFGVALVAVSWAFDGWNNITYIAGEIRQPARNLPLVLIGGTVIITTLYVLVNVVYLEALPMAEVVGELRIAEKAATAMWGATGATLVSGAVVISTFGALNGAIFVAPRVYFAMARDGVFFRRAAEVHPRFGTPAVAIVAQAIWAGLLTITGSYEQLFTYVVFVTLIYWAVTTAAVFTLRHKRPDLERPYRTWGYPWVPGLFIAATVAILLNTAVARPVESLTGLGIAALGVPVYFYWRRQAG
jgi:APA family basic amino acid/polyamine antiporter